MDDKILLSWCENAIKAQKYDEIKESETNGEVIQKLFPKDEFRIISGLNYVEQWHNGDHVQNYLYEWWNDKYEEESNG